VIQIARYMMEAAENGDVSGIDFWSCRETIYSSIAPLAEDRCITMVVFFIWTARRR